VAEPPSNRIDLNNWAQQRYRRSDSVYYDITHQGPDNARTYYAFVYGMICATGSHHTDPFAVNGELLGQGTGARGAFAAEQAASMALHNIALRGY
jgi:hypothetical protein